MAKKILQIIENGYRATAEEQDDTVVWFTHAMKGGGAEITVVLRGNAVNYAVRGQDASGLQFGAKKQTQPPDLAGDVGKLVGKGVPVFVVEEDVARRGIAPGELIDGVQSIAAGKLPALAAEHAYVWSW